MASVPVIRAPLIWEVIAVLWFLNLIGIQLTVSHYLSIFYSVSVMFMFNLFNNPKRNIILGRKSRLIPTAWIWLDMKE
jgi:hypothetical protein